MCNTCKKKKHSKPRRVIKPTLVKSSPPRVLLKTTGKHNSHAEWATDIANKLEHKYKGVNDQTVMSNRSGKIRAVRTSKSSQKKPKTKASAFWASKGGIPHAPKHCNKGTWVRPYHVKGYCRGE